MQFLFLNGGNSKKNVQGLMICNFVQMMFYMKSLTEIPNFIIIRLKHGCRGQFLFLKIFSSEITDLYDFHSRIDLFWVLNKIPSSCFDPTESITVMDYFCF